MNDSFKIPQNQICILIASDYEWEYTKKYFSISAANSTPLGEWFCQSFLEVPVTFFHTGWGKISAAASTQYVIDLFRPEFLINIGTCGGFQGRIEKNDLVLATKTITYDIFEKISDPKTAIEYYISETDWRILPETFAKRFKREAIASGDSDIDPKDIKGFIEKYDVSVADWESSAIAFVAKKNRRRILILRGVSDLVSETSGEVYGSEENFFLGVRAVLDKIIPILPEMISILLSDSGFK
ncbi:5'-methylthioadenosine/S-adenosylhomocysteine nucleosidase [Leptospira sp. 201903071]|uniref:5'-methylthioadenosine/S-adenosylhomocysteine nucleosidase family protein n=1 Tax=Leptospira ainazelensis TaxID=2810034 RepID=UPI00196696D2|nr:5'-methylthioadenosine/S-adenosylhomocysteine nucleosidase [Leptospira ainazelensis]MBM9502382.1 5'-methylthioadenosine/S-adenosylhomocysteine nucleosidase [Leptospira ainazelensis]